MSWTLRRLNVVKVVSLETKKAALLAQGFEIVEDVAEGKKSAGKKGEPAGKDEGR